MGRQDIFDIFKEAAPKKSLLAAVLLAAGLFAACGQEQTDSAVELSDMSVPASGEDMTADETGGA